MNSMRASPTPSLGRRLVRKATSGFPMLIMTLVTGRFRAPRSVFLTSKGSTPLKILPLSP